LGVSDEKKFNHPPAGGRWSGDVMVVKEPLKERTHKISMHDDGRFKIIPDINPVKLTTWWILYPSS
jgi:hypothetical protein